jgi:hypothetical protein
LVDVGPPKPPKIEVEDILDIPDPVEQAVKTVAAITPEERWADSLCDFILAYSL